jgi:hypothetical protein
MPTAPKFRIQETLTTETLSKSGGPNVSHGGLSPLYLCVATQRKGRAIKTHRNIVTAKALKIIVFHTEMVIIVMQAFVAVRLQWSANFKLGFKIQLMSNV